jgi:hypothetical protein
VIDDQPILNIPIEEEDEEGGQVVLDAAIRRMQQEQDARLSGPGQEPLRSPSSDGNLLFM